MSQLYFLGKAAAPKIEFSRCLSLYRAFLIAGVILFCTEYGAAQSLEKVRIGMPSLSLSFIAPQVAYARGFFRYRARAQGPAGEGSRPVGKVVDFAMLKEALHELGMR